MQLMDISSTEQQGTEHKARMPDSEFAVPQPICFDLGQVTY